MAKSTQACVQLQLHLHQVAALLLLQALAPAPVFGNQCYYPCSADSDCAGSACASCNAGRCGCAKATDRPCQMRESIYQCIDAASKVCCAQSFSHGYGAVCNNTQSCCSGYSIKTCYDPKTQICCPGNYAASCKLNQKCCGGSMTPTCCDAGPTATTRPSLPQPDKTAETRVLMQCATMYHDASVRCCAPGSMGGSTRRHLFTAGQPTTRGLFTCPLSSHCTSICTGAFTKFFATCGSTSILGQLADAEILSDNSPRMESRLHKKFAVFNLACGGDTEGNTGAAPAAEADPNLD